MTYIKTVNFTRLLESGYIGVINADLFAELLPVIGHNYT